MSDEAQGKTVAVIGAGIVGVSTAIWLQRDGWDVVLVDRKGPGEGASHGNGGVLASCSVVPVTVPGLLFKAPRMLFDPDQPLFLKWVYLPNLAPWLLKYLGHANAEAVKRRAAALTPTWLSGELSYYSAVAGRQMSKPRWLLVTHLFNHQTHHRGQVHALIKEAGAEPPALDIPVYWSEGG